MIRGGMIQKGNNMRLYECVFIIRQDLSTTQVDTITNELCAIITDHKGSVHKQEYWGLKTMAYKIKKNRKGHYVMLNFEADAATVAEFDRRIGLNEDVLRSLIIAIEAVDPEPSIMMQSKTERSGSDSDDASAA
jgi:small subunit ribosomal protein S6